MATSGYITKTLSGNSTYKFYIYYKVQSQDKIKGTTSLYVSFGLRKVGSNSASYNNTGSATLYGKINDILKKNGSVYFDLRKSSIGTEKSLYNTTVEIQHDADGTKTVPLYGYLDTAIGLGTAVISTSVELPKIPMSSTISATDARIGAASNVVISKAVESYNSSVQFSFGKLTGWLNASGEIVDEETIISATLISFAIPTEFYLQIPNSQTGTVTLTCTTYSGTTKIGGSQTTTFKVSIDPEQSLPTWDANIEDIDETAIALSRGSAIIKNLSDVKCAISASGNNGATIKEIKINGVDVTKTGTTTFVNTQYETYQVYVKDSRGLESVGILSSNIFVDYINPSISVTAKRVSQTSDDVDFSISGKFFCGIFGKILVAEDNAITILYRSRILNGEWGIYYTLAEYTTLQNSNEFSFSGTIEGIDYRNSHEIEFVAQDKAQSYSVVIKIPKGVPLYDWGKNDFRFHVPLTFDTEAREKTRENLGIESVEIPTFYSTVWKTSDAAANFDPTTLTIPGMSSWVFLAVVLMTSNTYPEYHVELLSTSYSGEFRFSRYMSTEAGGVFQYKRYGSINVESETITFKSGYYIADSEQSEYQSVLRPLEIVGFIPK